MSYLQLPALICKWESTRGDPGWRRFVTEGWSYSLGPFVSPLLSLSLYLFLSLALSLSLSLSRSVALSVEPSVKLGEGEDGGPCVQPYTLHPSVWGRDSGHLRSAFPPGTDLDPMSLWVRRPYRPPPTPNLVLLSQVRPCHSTTGPYPVTLLDLTFTSLSPHTSVADRSLPPAPT